MFSDRSLPFAQDQKKLATMEMQAEGRVKCCQVYNLLGQGPHRAPDCAYKMEET